MQFTHITICGLAERDIDSFLVDNSDEIKMKLVSTCDEGLEPTHPHF